MPTTATHSNYSLNTAFDIGLIPDELHTDDPFDQTEVYSAALIQPEDSRELAIQKFSNAPCVDIELAALERMFKDNNTTAAIQTLQSRHKIVYGSRHAAEVDSTKMFWETDASYLDMLVCVGLGLGLAPVIPSLNTHHNFSFKMDLKDGHRNFMTKHVTLGFNPVGAMMRIGKTGSGEDTWLAFIPREHPNGIHENEIPAASNRNHTKTTCLSLTQQRRTKMFLAHCFKHMNYRDILVMDRYPDVMDGKFENASNIFNRYLDLNLQDLKSLDQTIISQYYSWVAEAPDSYKEDNFFQSRYPICITSQFGQNNRLAMNLDEERITWDTDRDWSRIRYVNVALATHIRVNKVDGWYGADFDELVEAYPNGLFDSPDPASRNRLSYTQIQEILDANKADILPHVYDNRVYSDHGYIVDTHDPAYNGSPQAYGILIKAAGLQHAFNPPPTWVVPSPSTDELGDQVLEELPAANSSPAVPTPFHFYPQAGLRTVGHFQAKGLMSACYPIVARLNDYLRNTNGTNPVDSDLGNRDQDASENARVIQPISSQGYNSIMHHTRGRVAQHHDVLLGIVTAALAGQWAIPGSSSVQRADTALAGCKVQMPHHAFERKIDRSNLPRDLRLENVYCIDLMALHPSRRYGSVIIEEIIVPLLRIWDHASTRGVLERHIQLFRPSAFPALYLWTTFPLTVFLNLIFTQGATLYPAKKFKHALIVELCSVVERALNYLHTGNAAVIASSLMSPLWIGKALVTDGLPCLNPDIVIIINGSYYGISAQNWPMGQNLSNPLSSSRATQLFRYDERHFNRFYAYLGMAIAISKPPPPFVSETSEMRKRSFSLMTYCVTLFIDDCKNFVIQKVKRDIYRQKRACDPQPQYAELRQIALIKWTKESNPLSYGGCDTPAYASLLSCVSKNPQGDPPEGVCVTESLTYEELAKRIIKVAQPGSLVCAPLWKQGSFLTALQIAMPEISTLLAIEDPDTSGVMADILSTTMHNLKVEFVPWHGPSRRNRRYAVSHVHWMSIDKEYQPPPAGRRTLIQQATASLATTADGSPWSVPARLSEMKGLWSRALLPNEWSIDHARLEKYRGKDSCKYVVEVYEWVSKNYDKDNWRHHMALVWAILVAAILPNIYIPMEARYEVPEGASASELNSIIRSWPWIANPSATKKGIKQREPFITMVTTYIMAMLDRSSPLLQNLLPSSGFGAPWTSKHTSKYIHALNMIRLRIAEATNADVISISRFGLNYNLAPEADLKRLYNQVIGYLENREYGVYFAIQEIFGKKMADYAASRGHTKKPTSSTEDSRNESIDDRAVDTAYDTDDTQC